MAGKVSQVLAGVRVLDARSVRDFAPGHLCGSVNVGFDGRFAETAGMIADIGEKIALVTDPGEQHSAAMRLARVGSDDAIGYLNVDHDGVFRALSCPTWWRQRRGSASPTWTACSTRMQGS